MKPKISIVTLGVSDLEASVRFYRDGLGLPAPSYNDGDNICSSNSREPGSPSTHETSSPTKPISRSPNPVPARPRSPSPTTLPRFEAVDAAMQEAVDAGATLVKQPEEVFWGGYSGYFSDPDGYLWELAYNPFTDLT